MREDRGVSGQLRSRSHFDSVNAPIVCAELKERMRFVREAAGPPKPGARDAGMYAPYPGFFPAQR